MMCKIPLRPKRIANVRKKELKDGAKFSSIHEPAPARMATPTRANASNPSGSQACRSDVEGIIVLLMVNVR